jgi:hypothetical protein
MKGNSMKLKFMTAAMVAAALVSSEVLPQQAFVYPSRGQSPQQQQKDEFDCHQWAIQQTGFDPSNPRQASAPPPPPSGGGVRESGSGARRAV